MFSLIFQPIYSATAYCVTTNIPIIFFASINNRIYNIILIFFVGSNTTNTVKRMHGGMRISLRGGKM